MPKTDSLISVTISSALTALLGATSVEAAGLVQCAEQERCYGISRVGTNDCATATSSCAGTAKQDFQKDAWVYVPKGTCNKLAGSSLQPPAAGPSK